MERTITVELLGLARALTRLSAVPLTVPPDATLRDVMRVLAATCPTLIGIVLTQDGELMAGNAVSLDGRAVVTRSDGRPLPDRPELTLLTTPEGG